MKEIQFNSMDVIPKREDILQKRSRLVMVYATNLEQCELGMYSYLRKKWVLLSDLFNDFICWSELPLPEESDVSGFQAINYFNQQNEENKK